MRSKGQFMIISAVVVGLIVISVGTAISKTQTREFTNTDTAYQLNNIRTEAEKVEMTDSKERENFEKMVEMLGSYSSTTEYWDEGSKNCYNVTLVSTTRRYELNCLT